MDNWGRPFWRSVFSGEDGTGSTSRVLTAIVVLCALGWVTVLVLHTRTIPDLTNLTIWVSSVTATLYGTNKLTAIFSKKDGGPQ